MALGDRRRLGGRRWATAWRLLRSGDLPGLVRRTLAFLGRLGDRPTPVDYTQWRRRWVEVDDDALARIDELVAALPHRPSFCVVVPTDGADPEAVAATVASLDAQHYPDWVMCLTGSDTPDPAVAEAVAAAGDPRVRFTGPAPKPSGEWVARLSPGDLVHEAALYAIANAIVQNPETAVVYTDHDHVGPDGRFIDPHMKPDWNPDLLAGMDYFGILTAYRAELWEAHAVDTINPHDLALRIMARLEAGQVVHVPHVLAAIRVSGDGSHLVPDTVRVSHPLPNRPPRVSLLIPSRDRGRMLVRCLSSVRDNTDYPDFEVIVVDHDSTEAKARQVIEDLRGDVNTQVIGFSGPFNFASMINKAARQATGEVLVLLNNDTEVTDPGWLTELVGQVVRPEVGIVGPLLTFGNGTVQHAGVHPAVGGLMGHGHKHRRGEDPGYFGRLRVAHEVAAVTGACLAVEATTWERLDGMDEKHLAVAYNDIDLCLKARKAGLRVIFTPYARLTHHESMSRGFDDDPSRNDRLAGEAAVMSERWGEALHFDPAYSPNLSLDGGGFDLADPPRAAPSWGPIPAPARLSDNPEAEAK